MEIMVVSSLLTKKHTLKIQALLPITGNKAPLGNICIKPIEFIVNKVNQQRNLLPDYNIVVDVADDQCSGSTGIKEILPFFFSDRVHNKTNGRIGSYQLPQNQTMLWESAETYLVPPLLMGSICSSVCEFFGSQLQDFQLVAFAISCNSDVLADNDKFPNLYRRFQKPATADTIAKFLIYLQWDYVAFISDSNKLNILSTEEAMIKLQSNNVTVAGMEVFISDPIEAVERIKSKGVRVVIVNCFYDLCPLVACAAYKAGLYGGRVVWLFPMDMPHFIQFSRTSCQTSEMEKIIDHSFFLFTLRASEISTTDPELYTSKLNFTLADVDDFIKEKFPEIENFPLYDFRTMCIDNIAPSIFILDELENKLNNQGRTLVDVIGVDHMQHELMEMSREVLESLKLKLLTGPLDFNGDRVNVPPETGFSQYQNGVYEESFSSSESKAVGKIKWTTPDGVKPRARPTSVSLTIQGVFWLNRLLKVLHCLFIFFLVGLMVFNWKRMHFGNVEKFHVFSSAYYFTQSQ